MLWVTDVYVYSNLVSPSPPYHAMTQMASLGGFHDIAQLLLQHGADLCAKSKYGKNALDFARSFDRQAGGVYEGVRLG